jgi:hypothetical protein
MDRARFIHETRRCVIICLCAGALEHIRGPLRRNKPAILARSHRLGTDGRLQDGHLLVIDSDECAQFSPTIVEWVAGTGRAHPFDIDWRRCGGALCQGEIRLGEEYRVAVKPHDNRRP